MMINLLVVVVLVATAFQLVCWSVLFDRLARFQLPDVPQETSSAHPVSIIICARDEAENLRRNLPLFLQQTYPEFEVLVVNDNSQDETSRILLDFQKNYTNLTVVNVGMPTQPGKKQALRLGIQQARFDRLLFSDADCRPSGPLWLTNMQAPLQGAIEIVLGFSPYQQGTGLLNRFIRFEAVYTAVQYFSFALVGIPYMGVGRNLGYTRKLFLASDQFASHTHIASGDDDLFVNQVAQKKNTAVVLRSETFVYSASKDTWTGYYNQKKRHLSTGTRYRPLHQLLLGSIALSHVGHYLGLVALLVWVPAAWGFALLLLVARLGLVAWQYRRILRLLNHPDLLRWIPLLDLLLTVYYLLFAPVLFIGNKQSWKQ